MIRPAAAGARAAGAPAHRARRGPAGAHRRLAASGSWAPRPGCSRARRCTRRSRRSRWRSSACAPSASRAPCCATASGWSRTTSRCACWRGCGSSLFRALVPLAPAVLQDRRAGDVLAGRSRTCDARGPVRPPARAEPGRARRRGCSSPLLLRPFGSGLAPSRCRGPGARRRARPRAGGAARRRAGPAARRAPRRRAGGGARRRRPRAAPTCSPSVARPRTPPELAALTARAAARPEAGRLRLGARRIARGARRRPDGDRRARARGSPRCGTGASTASRSRRHAADARRPSRRSPRCPGLAGPRRDAWPRGRLFELADTPPPVDERPAAAPARVDRARASRAACSTSRDLRFRYPGAITTGARRAHAGARRGPARRDRRCRAAPASRRSCTCCCASGTSARRDPAARGRGRARPGVGRRARADRLRRAARARVHGHAARQPDAGPADGPPAKSCGR